MHGNPPTFLHTNGEAAVAPPPGGVQWNWSQVGSFWPPKTSMVLLFYLLKLNVLKNSVLEGSGLDFGASGLRFWSLGASIFEPLGSVGKAKVWPKCNQNVRISFPHVPSAMQSCTCKPTKHGGPPTFLHTNGEAAVAPPWGESMELKLLRHMVIS